MPYMCIINDYVQCHKFPKGVISEVIETEFDVTSPF